MAWLESNRGRLLLDSDIAANVAASISASTTTRDNRRTARSHPEGNRA